MLRRQKSCVKFVESHSGVFQQCMITKGGMPRRGHTSVVGKFFSVKPISKDTGKFSFHGILIILLSLNF